MYRELRPDGTVRLTGSIGGGEPGPEGPEGPQGTRWGTTTAWHFAGHIDQPCEMVDGGAPRVGDMLVCVNPIGQGELYSITAVYPVTDNVDFDYLGTIRGPKGDKGDTGDQGPAGQNGSKWFKGDNIPDAGTPAAAVTGDFYLRSNGDVYVKGIGEWSTTINIKGPKGDKGDQGDPGPPGGVLDAWPVDSVYISFVSTNPSTLFGGTWVAIGQGRMLVGVNPSDVDFDAAGKTGGEKTHTLTTAELPSHTHAAGTLATASDGVHTHSLERSDSTGASGANIPEGQSANSGSGSGPVNSSGGHTHNITGSTAAAGSGSAHNNMPPYLAVYMWRRTA